MSDNIENKEEKIEISKADLSSLMDRIAKLETGNTMVKAERAKYHTAKVWFVDDEKTLPIVGYGKNRNDKQVDGTEVLMVEVLFRNDKDEIKSKWLPMTEFRNSDNYIIGKIKSIKEDPKIIVNGSTRLKNLDYDKYRTTDTDIEVPLEVVIPNSTYEMELPDGRIIELPENALN